MASQHRPGPRPRWRTLPNAVAVHQWPLLGGLVFTLIATFLSSRWWGGDWTQVGAK